MPISRSYVSSKFLLNLAGVPAGFVKSVEGGGVTAEVVTESLGPSYYTKKHLGQIKYEEFTIQISLSMDKSVYDWIAKSWQMDYQRKDGSIITADYNLDAKSERQFFNALITEMTVPALDASSKDAAYLAVKFQPETVQFKKGSGKVSSQASVAKSDAKLWLPSNFRLEIAGLECSKVSRIDSFSVKRAIVIDDVGQARDYQTEAGKLEFPNLKISLSEASAQTWIDWHDDFVIKGNNGEGYEKNGSIVFLSANKATELGRINLFNLGIFRIASDENDASSESIQRVTAELYCERMEFQYGQPKA